MSSKGNLTSDTVENVTANPGRDENLARVEISVLAVIFILAVVSNVLMLVAIWRQRQYRPLSRMYYFMLHLSFADLLVAIFNILPQLAWDITFRFQGGDVLCRFVKYVQIMPLYLSTYILMFMAVDRYRAVCSSSNLHWNSLKVAKCMITVSWVVAILLALPQAIIFGQEEISPGVTDCWVRFIEPWGAKAYVTWFVVSIFGGPLLVIAICYGVITHQIWIYSRSALPESIYLPASQSDSANRWVKLRRWILRLSLRWKRNATITQPKSIQTTTDESLPSESAPLRSRPLCCTVSRPIALRRSNSNRITKAKMKTIKLTLTVVICFTVCWAPFCITQLILVYNPPDSMETLSPAIVIMVLLASLNSCTNPWVYLAFSGSLLNQMRVCLGLRLRRGSDNDSIGDDAPDRRALQGGVSTRHKRTPNRTTPPQVVLEIPRGNR